MRGRWLRGVVAFSILTIPLFAKPAPLEEPDKLAIVHVTPDFHRSEAASHQNAFEYFLVFLRTAIVSSSILFVYSLDPSLEASLKDKLVPALCGGALSGTCQYFHLSIKDWIDYKSNMKHPLDLKGLFRLKKDGAHFLESFFVKEFLLQLAWYQLFQFSEAGMGIASHYFSSDVFKTAVLGLSSDGIWTVNNIKLTGFLERKFPKWDKVIARSSRLIQVGLAGAITFFLVHQKLGHEWSYEAVKFFSAGGIAVALMIYRKPLVTKITSCFHMLRKLGGSF